MPSKIERCRNAAAYTQGEEVWGDKLYRAGYHQGRCKDCRLWVIWHKPNGDWLEFYDDVPTKVRDMN